MMTNYVMLRGDLRALSVPKSLRYIAQKARHPTTGDSAKAGDDEFIPEPFPRRHPIGSSLADTEFRAPEPSTEAGGG